MLTPRQKENAIELTRTHSKDTGSSPAQVALLSKEIEKLQSHLKKNPKDQHSKRGLLKMVIKRKKLLKYLEKDDKRKHSSVVRKLGLKK